MLAYYCKICKQIILRKKQVKKIFAITLLISLLGMNTIPCYAKSSTNNNQSSPKVFKSMVEKNKKQNSDTYKYDYVNMDWWSNFNDPILSGYIAKAIENNYDLKMASLAVEEYYQAVKIQFANELPTIGAGFSSAYAKMPEPMEWDWTFATPAYVNYEADLFLKNRDKTKASKKQYEASKFDERAAYIAIAGAVGTTYINIVKLDKIIDLQREIVKLRQDIYNLMLISNREGLISTSDTIKANKSLVTGQTELIEYQKQREKLMHAVLIGESPENISELVITPYNQINFTGNIPQEIPSDIIVQRPDFLKAETMVEKSGIDVRVARKEFLPTINLTGLAMFSSNKLGSLWSTNNMIGALAGGIMLPIFTGGARIANLKLKKATYERILQNYYKTNLIAIQEVNDALVSVKKDNEKMVATLKQLDLEKADYRLQEKKYNQGVISRLDLIQRQENLLNINRLVTQQNVECMVDYIGLYKAVGSKL